jgi:hypothetical protein
MYFNRPCDEQTILGGMIREYVLKVLPRVLQTVISPPQSVSITFNDKGLVTKYTVRTRASTQCIPSCKHSNATRTLFRVVTEI